jgi:5-formyltetrahydrofolate cyclo-ligase
MCDPEILCAGTIFSYQPFKSEVDIDAFNVWAQAEGKALAFPLCRDVSVGTGAGVMEAAIPEGDGALRPGRFGITAPAPERSRIIAPDEIDIVLVPCVGFDGRGVRLGMGGGFYDRYLPQCANALKIGVAFSFQKVTVPFGDPWDATLDRVITDE